MAHTGVLMLRTIEDGSKMYVVICLLFIKFATSSDVGSTTWTQNDQIKMMNTLSTFPEYKTTEFESARVTDESDVSTYGRDFIANSTYSQILPGEMSTTSADTISSLTVKSFLELVVNMSSYGDNIHFRSTSFQDESQTVGQISVQITASTSDVQDLEDVSPSFSNTPDLQYYPTPLFLTTSRRETTHSIPAHTLTPFENGNNSELGSISLTGYFLTNSVGLEDMTVRTSVVFSDWLVTSVYQTFEEVHISSIKSNMFSRGIELVTTPTIVTESLLSSTVACCQPFGIPNIPNEDKGWAVPVTVCLSTALIVTWIILVVVCRRSTSGQHHDLADDNGAHIEAEDHECQLESYRPHSGTTTHPRHDKYSPQNIRQQQRYHHDQKYNRNADTILRNSYDIHNIAFKTSRDGDMIELDKMSQKESKEKYFPERYNQQTFNDEFRIEHDALTYDNYFFIPSSTESNNDRFDPFRSPSWRSYRTSESMETKLCSTDPNHNMHVEAHVTSDKKYKDEYVNPVRMIPSKRYNTETLQNSHPHFNFRREDMSETYPLDNPQLRSLVNSEEPHGKKNSAHLDTLDNAYHGTDGARFKTDKIKQGMPRCVSFDDTRFRTTNERLVTLNKEKSPTRKISTISDTGTGYLVLAHDGHMGMNSCYETVSNLAEVGNSSVGSRFFIGSSSDHINLMCQNRIQSNEHLLQRASNHELDELTELSISEGNPITNTSLSNNSNDKDFEAHSSKPNDDYVFPIMRKAKQKITEERQQRKLTETKSSESKDENIFLDDAQSWEKQGTDRKYQGDYVNAHPDMTKPQSSLPSSRVVTSTSHKPRVSHLSNIPTIILTVEENDMEVEQDKRDHVQQSPVPRQPRVRRIARANNPFLIEAQSPPDVSLEKVRRSSAPAMARGELEPAVDNVCKDGMIRSASGDHLCLSSHPEQLRQNELGITRSWSSEFLEILKNSQSENRSQTERLKKMIDDRYDALFNKKYPELMTSTKPLKQSYLQDPNTKTTKRINIYRSKPLFEESVENADYETFMDMRYCDTLSRFRPISEIRKSDSLSDSEQDQHLKNDSIHVQMGYSPTSIHSKDLTLGGRKDIPSNPEFIENINLQVASQDNRSPRPSLTQGTDGQDSDQDNSKADATSLRYIDSENSTQSSSTGYDRYKRSLNNTRKFPGSEKQWESFEDYSEKSHQSSSTPASEKALNAERNWRTRYILPKIAKQSPERATEHATSLPNRVSNDLQKRNPISLQFIEASTMEEDRNVTDKRFDELKRSSFMPVGTSRGNTQHKSTSISHPESAASTAQPKVYMESFEDNFDEQIKKDETLKTIIQDHSGETILNQSDQEQRQQRSIIGNKKMLGKTTLTVPVKPPRGTRGRNFKNVRNNRPPSPYMLNKETGTLTENSQTDGCQSEENISIPYVNTDSSHQESTSKQSIPDVVLSSPRYFKSRSLSLEGPRKLEDRRTQRAITLATDKLIPHFTSMNEWYNLVTDNESTFVSSANNTLLQHNSREDINCADSSMSAPELVKDFGSTPTPLNVARKSTNRVRSKLLALYENQDNGLQVSSI